MMDNSMPMREVTVRLTDGEYRGGGYLVRFEDGRLAEVRLEVRDGLARFVDLTVVEVM